MLHHGYQSVKRFPIIRNIFAKLVGAQRRRVIAKELYSVTVSFCPCVSVPEDPRLECLHHRSPKHGYHRQICSLCVVPSPARRICDRRPSRCSQKRRWTQWSNWTCNSPALQSCNPTGTRDGSCASPRLEPRSKPLRSPLERCIWIRIMKLMRFRKLMKTSKKLQDCTARVAFKLETMTQN